jgi:hypothetical protein
VYDGHEVPRSDPAQEFGYYLKRAGDPRPWRTLADPEQAIRTEHWRGKPAHGR